MDEMINTYLLFTLLDFLRTRYMNRLYPQRELNEKVKFFYMFWKRLQVTTIHTLVFLIIKTKSLIVVCLVYQRDGNKILMIWITAKFLFLWLRSLSYESISSFKKFVFDDVEGARFFSVYTRKRMSACVCAKVGV